MDINNYNNVGVGDIVLFGVLFICVIYCIEFVDGIEEVNILYFDEIFCIKEDILFDCIYGILVFDREVILL